MFLYQIDVARLRRTIKIKKKSKQTNKTKFLSFSILYPRMKISVSTDISVLGFYGYIGYIGGYLYMNIDISEIKLL